MRALFKDSEHLFRMGGLYAAGTVLLLVAQFVLVPADFGELGHYRTGAIADNRERGPAYAGASACAVCHEDVVAEISEGAHARVNCEACHGPLATHAEELTEPELPAGAGDLCMVCHARSTAKPAGFPQVDRKEHAADEPCNSCHTPHAPAF